MPHSPETILDRPDTLQIPLFRLDESESERSQQITSALFHKAQQDGGKFWQARHSGGYEAAGILPDNDDIESVKIVVPNKNQAFITVYERAAMRPVNVFAFNPDGLLKGITWINENGESPASPGKIDRPVDEVAYSKLVQDLRLLELKPAAYFGRKHSNVVSLPIRKLLKEADGRR